MNFDELIKNWHIKASEEDYYSKFVFEYLAFIAFLKKKKFNDSKNDRQAIQLLKQDINIKESYLKRAKKSPAKLAWEKIMDELNKARLGNISGSGHEVVEIKWWNCSHLDLANQKEEEKKKIKGVIQDFDDWENMVEYWYSIRNNLFHGGKDPAGKRNKLLVENAYITLRTLVKLLLENESGLT